MLDMKWIRTHQEQVEAAARHKGMLDFNVAELLETEEQRRELGQRVDVRRAERNRASAEIARLMRQKQSEGAGGREELAEADLREGQVEAERGEWQAEVEKRKEQVRVCNTALVALEAELAKVDARFQALQLLVPNIASPDTPIGASDADNVQIKVVGEPTAFVFEPRDHVQLGEALDIIDIPRGVKVAGTRNYYLKGMGLYLHRAVQQLAIDVLADRGFTVMDVPLMVREEALVNAAFFPGGKDQTYELDGENKWLVGTSEGPLVSYFANEIVDLSQGPIRLAGVSNCFRKEAGSAGRDVRGLYRVHQFAKVEQVVICLNDPQVAEQMLDEITRNAEHILQLLELPYRIVAVCTGDMGSKNYKQYDIETWMPSRGNYGETHSSSSLLDYQARRCGIRYSHPDGGLQYGYTLNNTAVATPRILIPLLENHQQEDGSIYIPPALRPYMRGMASIPAR
ncbi:serine--tRNA ligase [Paenibacillus aestuarii]|uniref:Serine--tRNA ligase n=1 Tax=Paenibacillus aestuarii TaxID=516965 RepID=A0ABW0KG81_9BACL|nr:serine--tRNA ligase [Paenibacillus aestuarii]